jgi:hypothetical protein
MEMRRCSREVSLKAPFLKCVSADRIAKVITWSR